MNEPRVPVGTRIELIHMPADPDPIPDGSRGTVIGGSTDQLWIDWDDSSRTLNLDLRVDRYKVIDDE